MIFFFDKTKIINKYLIRYDFKKEKKISFLKLM
jgi:hypothetical protein